MQEFGYKKVSSVNSVIDLTLPSLFIRFDTVSYSILLISTKLNKSVSVRVGSFIPSKEIVYGFVIIPVTAIIPLPSPTVTEFPALVVKTAFSSVFTPSLSTLPTFTLNVIVRGYGVPILVLPDSVSAAVAKLLVSCSASIWRVISNLVIFES